MPASALHADRPITRRDEDLLDRSALVAQLVRWVANAPMDGGFVVGLTGPWGSGKTSVLGLLAEQLESEDITVMWLEPWLFSDADQLVTRFFDEVADQLKGARAPRLTRIAGRMAEYGAALSPSASALLGLGSGNRSDWRENSSRCSKSQRISGGANFRERFGQQVAASSF